MTPYIPPEISSLQHDGIDTQVCYTCKCGQEFINYLKYFEHWRECAEVHDNGDE